MKKLDIIFPVLITTLFAGIVLGILFSRWFSNAIISLPATNSQVTASTENGESTTSETVRKLNINTASAKELAILPGIGDGIAQKIVDYRNEIGSFTSIEELQNVDGIGQKRFDAISKYITVE